MTAHYLKRILTARVYDVARESPLDEAPQLSARIGNRLEPQRSAAVLAVAGGVLLTVALVLPVSALSPLLFGAVGLAFGPIFPLVVAAAGARMPGESATVTGTLVFAAVVGAVVVTVIPLVRGDGTDEDDDRDLTLLRDSIYDSR